MFTKFFKNGKTFSAYCRMRYGQSKAIWDTPRLWEKRGMFAIAFDEEAADAMFAPKASTRLKPAHREAAFDEENYAERQAEDMAAYIASGAGLDNYYKDRDAGYAY